MGTLHLFAMLTKRDNFRNFLFSSLALRKEQNAPSCMRCLLLRRDVNFKMAELLSLNVLLFVLILHQQLILNVS